jgi:hypothetical protein
MEDEIGTVPESQDVVAYLVPPPDVVIPWLDEIEGFISTHAYS